MNRMQKAVPRMVTITDKAANKMKQYMAKSNEHFLGLRLSVESSSCSCCTSYGLMLEKSFSDSDVVVEDKGVTMILSESDVKYFEGAEIDYIETLQKSGFRINNPNNMSACGCS